MTGTWSKSKFRTEPINKGKFRFFQDYSEIAVWERIERDPGVAFFTRGLIIKSLKMFKVLDSTGGDHKHNKALQKAIKPFLENIWDAIQSDIALGYGLLTFSTPDKTSEDDDDKRFSINNYWKHQIDYRMDKQGFMSYISGDTSILKPADGVEPEFMEEYGTLDKVKKENLKFCKFIGSIKGDKKGEFKPWLSQLWDDLFGWNIISSSCVIFTLRNGAGLWAGQAPSNFLKNNKQLIQEGLTEADAEGTVIFFPMMTDEKGNKIELQQMSGDQIDFIMNKEIVLGRISLGTSVPKSRIEGITQGQQAGEVFIDKELSEAKQLQQDKFQHVFTWAVERTSEKLGLAMGEDWDVGFEKREELSTRGIAEVLGIKMKNFNELRKVMSLEDAAKQADLDFDDIVLTEPEPIDMSGDGDDSEEDSEDDETDDTEEDLLDEKPLNN